MKVEIHPYLTTEGLKKQLNLSNQQVIKGKFLPGGVWFPHTRVIVCGTFPPMDEYKNRQGYFYYSSNHNKFWKHIDKIYKQSLFLLSDGDDEKRINNAKAKIKFIKKRFGFIDIYSKTSREEGREHSASDNDLIPVKTIFQNSIFEDVLGHSVDTFVFVYKQSRDEFLKCLRKSGFDRPKIIRAYRTKGIPLEVRKSVIDSKVLFLCYSSIHGNNPDASRQKALKMALEWSMYRR